MAFGRIASRTTVTECCVTVSMTDSIRACLESKQQWKTLSDTPASAAMDRVVVLGTPSRVIARIAASVS